jgi:hypothetical protein
MKGTPETGLSLGLPDNCSVGDRINHTRTQLVVNPQMARMIGARSNEHEAD